jgi:sec-independent protein translocase protein TatB
MLDIGWSELLMIAVVAIIVVGPKDLPRALRTAGQWLGKARGMAREFQNSVDDMIRDSALEDLKKEAQEITDFDLEETLERQLDPTGSDDDVFDAEALEAFDAPADPKPADPKPADPGPDYADAENMAPPHSLTPPVATPTAEAPTAEAEPEEVPETTSNQASG